MTRICLALLTGWISDSHVMNVADAEAGEYRPDTQYPQPARDQILPYFPTCRKPDSLVSCVGVWNHGSQEMVTAEVVSLRPLHRYRPVRRFLRVVAKWMDIESLIKVP
jgi:hypothetical protein